MKLIDNWRRVLLRSWAVYAATLGLLLPDLLQLLADHIDSLPYLDEGHKSLIRVACLAAVIVLRVVKQPGGAL